jgi:hypothetical protein
MRGYISAVDDLTIDDSHRLQWQMSDLKKEGDQSQKLRQEKDNEMKTMKQKYEEMSSTLQNILTVISNLEQPVDKNKIAQELILKGNYKIIVLVTRNNKSYNCASADIEVIPKVLIHLSDRPKIVNSVVLHG